MFEDFFAQLQSVSLIQASLYIIGFAVLLLVISAVIFIFLRRRSPAELHAEHIAKLALNLKKGKSTLLPQKKAGAPADEIVSQPAPLVAKKIDAAKTEGSLKSLLIKKFHSKIESQLGSKVIVSDLSSSEKNFVAHVEVAGVKLLLTLDSSGKIIDYKKLKQ